MSENTNVIMDDRAVERALTRISYEIIERNKGTRDLVLVGIMRGGVPLAGRLAEKIGANEQTCIPVGELDITPMRDDRKKSPASEDKSRLPDDLENKHVIIVDDVLYTGRSARAAIDSIMLRGRPLSIQLVVLIDRGHRELPIRADYVGKNLPTSSDEQVVVTADGTPEDSVKIIKGKREANA